MMRINKKELKIISYDFRCLANRVLNSDYKEAVSILKMFINFIESNSLIFDYVRSNIKVENDIKTDMSQVCSSYGRAGFSTGETQEEEVSYTYQLLKYIVENQTDYRIFTRGYADSNHYQDMAKGFHNRVVLPFVNYIEGYLTKIGIEMGYDEERQYMITINNTNGQVNISQDNSRLNAVQNQYSNVKELEELIRDIKESINEEIGDEEKEVIIDSVDCLQEELQKESPKKGLIKNCLSGLTNVIGKIPTAIALCEKIKTLIEYVHQNIPQ